MTIKEIKKVIGVKSLEFKYSFDEEGVQTEWLTTWDDEKRLRVVAHQDVIEAIKEDSQYLNVKDKEIKVGKESGKQYTQYTLYAFSKPDFVC